MITEPNSYYFVSSTNYAAVGATSATVSVAIQPGDPSWTGSCGYATASSGTGVAGQDYTPVSGTLYFSGPAWRTFSVPVHPGPVAKSVGLQLVNAGTSSRPWATLVIPAAPPVLTLGCETNCLRLCWDARYTNCIVESTTNFVTGPWTAVGQAPSQSNGVCVVRVTADRSVGFFRLRRPQ